MSDITRKDLESFLKVLSRIKSIAEKEPGTLLDFISSHEPREDESAEDFSLPNDLNPLTLYDIAKERSKDEMVDYLSKYNLGQLRAIIKTLKFGYNRSKTKATLSEYIADQLKKRTTDVFREHQ